MPEMRYLIEYKDGVEVNRIPYEVSDGELAIEAVEAETAAANDQALVAYQNWAHLTPVQKDRVLKALLGEFISQNRSCYRSG